MASNTLQKKKMIEIQQNGYIIYFSGKLLVTHRANGLPAVEYVDGRKEYWEDGKRHRANGLPAIVYPNFHNPFNKNIGRYVYKKTVVNITVGGEIFYGVPKQNMLGNMNGSSIGLTCAMGRWFIDGILLHRICGKPAVKYPHGAEEYWINGNRILADQFWQNGIKIYKK